MIESFFGTDSLDSPQAFLAALVIGLFFGVALERAGFGSSKRLAGIFYFRDMAVLKVMFSALITAMLGLSYCIAFGWTGPEQLYFMSTVYGAQIVGGLMLGVGFVMSGWCPGTAAVGLASGKIDALVFLLGAVLGSILFNELFPVVKPLYEWGDAGIIFVHDSLGVSKAGFGLGLTVIAVACFWGSEYIEKKRGAAEYLVDRRFLKAYSLTLVVLAAGLLLFPEGPRSAAASWTSAQRMSDVERERRLLMEIDAALDHIEPEELADRLMTGGRDLLLVDIRSSDEYESYHIRGAVNVPMSGLFEYLAHQAHTGIVVLYSNGMTHPAQARDALYRMGYRNVYILTDGLRGFMERCLKPVSLRRVPVSEEQALRIQAWRAFFGAVPAGVAASAAESEVPLETSLPGLLDTNRLAEMAGRGGLVILDVRSQPEYNTAHIPGSISISVESFRGVVRGIPSMLLPADMLARHFSRMGIRPSDLVVIVYGDRILDATLVGMAFERLGHANFAVLDGGFAKWASENRPVDAVLPDITVSTYPENEQADQFTVDYRKVLEHVQNGGAVILDVRPAEFHRGTRSDEARAGRIPGSVNRPFSEDVVRTENYTTFKPLSELAAAYSALIPHKDYPVIVHCRTGHQASQTFFVLKRLLGYSRVYWYDAGWTEWSARSELPVETGS